MKMVVFDHATEAKFRKDWIDPRVAMKVLEARYDCTNTTMLRIATALGLPARKTDPWTEELVAEISRRYVAGELPSTLAAEFKLTRNQVTSKLDRLGVLRRKPSKRAAAESEALNIAPKAAPRLRIAGRGAIFQEAEARPPRWTPPERDEGPAVIITIPGARACKWPIGDPRREGFGYCGEPADGPYCSAHRRIAYQPKTPKKITVEPLVERVRPRFRA